MLYAHGEQVAITVSGGIDSVTLAYALCAQWRNQENPPSKVWLLACNYQQANWPITANLLQKHLWVLNQQQFLFPIDYSICTVTLPDTELGSPLFQKGYVPKTTHGEEFSYGNEEKTHADELVDGRNIFLFTHMMSFCSKMGIPILEAAHQYEPSEWKKFDSYRHRTEDFGPLFIDRMNLAQELGFKNRVRLEAPFLSMRYAKKDICKLAIDLGIDLVNDTYSCQFFPECGVCDNCVCRARTFKELGLVD